MTFRSLLVLLVALALFPPMAQAHTTIIEPPESHFPYQQWVDDAKVPTPTVEVTVEEVGSPCGIRHAAGCQVQGEISISLELGSSADARPVFLHELGHEFDADVLTSGERQRAKGLFHRSGDPWAPMVEEAFADSYSWCARLSDFTPERWYPVEQARVDGAQLTKVCELIRRAAMPGEPG